MRRRYTKGSKSSASEVVCEIIDITFPVTSIICGCLALYNKSKYLHSQQLPVLDPTSKLVNPSLCFLFNPNVAEISVASPRAILNSVQHFSH
ncbi:hypothetical protein CDAR_237551 [Caerostris darwini]|uniref:Uncharacterized protein n=1 Tax=Caerostris darwini TaxID=1538125 RepID=A0AAV4NIH0_9ARAC|nr:hypothetical protein CDAR_237551 [Caerostris darwini]